MNKRGVVALISLSMFVVFSDLRNSLATDDSDVLMQKCIQAPQHFLKDAKGHYYACDYSQSSDLSLAMDTADGRARAVIAGKISPQGANLRGVMIVDHWRRGDVVWALARTSRGGIPGAAETEQLVQKAVKKGGNPPPSAFLQSNQTSKNLGSAQDNSSAADSWGVLAKTFDKSAETKQKKLEDWESGVSGQQMAATNPEAFNKYVENQENQISEDERFSRKYHKMADADLIAANGAQPKDRQLSVSRCMNNGAGDVSETCRALLQNINYSGETAQTLKPQLKSMTASAVFPAASPNLNFGLPGEKPLFLNPKIMSEAGRYIDRESLKLKQNVKRHNAQAKRIALKRKKLKAVKKQPVKSNDLICFRYESQLAQEPLPFVGGLQKLFDQDCRGKDIDDSKTNQDEVPVKKQKEIVSAYKSCIRGAEGKSASDTVNPSLQKRDQDVSSGKASLLGSAASVHACVKAKLR